MTGATPLVRVASLDGPVPHSADVLAEQHGTEPTNPGGVVERPEERLALGDREREHLHHSPVGILEPGAEGVVVDQACEFEDGFVSERAPAGPWFEAVPMSPCG